MRSASALALGVVLVGCTTTAQQAARLRVSGARVRASQRSVRVVAPDPQVRIEALAIVRAAGESAFVVRVRDLAGHPLSDLPISVGVIARAGRRVYLNRTAGLDYFQTHLPGFGPGRPLAWVFTTGVRLPAAARPFALVGAREPGVGQLPQSLPTIVTARETELPGGGVGLKVRNASSVPQYQLQLYAVARRDGRYVAAGHGSVALLDSGASHFLRLRLAGVATGASVAVQAAPTIFG